MIRRLPLLLAFVLLGLSLATHAAAQEVSIKGVVRDATGGGLPGATVTATNQTTRESRSVTTGADGSYSLSLPQVITPSRCLCQVSDG
jgi:Carboxypeptidase regulatory-like domain